MWNKMQSLLKRIWILKLKNKCRVYPIIITLWLSGVSTFIRWHCTNIEQQIIIFDLCVYQRSLNPGVARISREFGVWSVPPNDYSLGRTT